MRDLLTVAKFTMKEMVRRKSFLISNLIILVIIVIGFNVPNILNSFESTDSSEQQDTVLMIDETGMFASSVESLNQMDIGKKFELSEKQLSKEEISAKIESEEIDEAIIIKENENNIQIEYVVDSLGLSGTTTLYEEVFTELYKNIKLAQMGISPEQIITINEPIQMEVTETKEGSSGGMLFAMMMLCIVLFYAIYFCAYQVSASITTEKTSKIMETLVTSTTPRTIVLGKTLGIGLVGLGQVLVIALVAILSYKLFLPEGMLDGIFDIRMVTPKFAILTVIYFLLGYTLFAFLYALTGSTVSKPEDVQSANGPIAIVAVIGFYLAYFSMMNPTSEINTFASIFPISSPFSMPFRIIGNTASNFEIIISLVLLILTIAVVANVAIKIYSSAILHYGTKLSIKDLFKIYREK